jgi:hypothetical protein
VGSVSTRARDPADRTPGGHRDAGTESKSKSRRKNPARALRAAGVEVIYSRIDWPGNLPGNEPTADAWSRHWVRCIEEARECDALLFVNGEDGQACGALIELGAALAAGRQVFVVSPDMTFSYHPNCRNFSALADAIAAIVAMQAGEAARGYSASISGTNSP